VSIWEKNSRDRLSTAFLSNRNTFESNNQTALANYQTANMLRLALKWTRIISYSGERLSEYEQISYCESALRQESMARNNRELSKDDNLELIKAYEENAALWDSISLIIIGSISSFIYWTYTAFIRTKLWNCWASSIWSSLVMVGFHLTLIASYWCLAQTLSMFRVIWLVFSLCQT
jgi:hypothetical protein